MPFDFLKPKPKATVTRYPTDFLLGDLLIKAGLISQQQLDEAVKLAGNKHVHVGQMLVNFRYISPRDLQAAVDAQSALRDRTIDPTVAARCLKIACKTGMSFVEVVQDQNAGSSDGLSNKLGELLFSAGLINKEQFAKSMQRSLATGLPLGRILVLNGSLSEPILTMALELQVRIRDEMMTREEAIESLSAAGGTPGLAQEETIRLTALPQPRRHGIRLGELFVLAGLLAETDVMNALELGLVNDQPIGQVLVGQGYISEEILEAALELQKRVDDSKTDAAGAAQALKEIKKSGLEVDSVLEEMDRKIVEAPKQNLTFDKLLMLARVVTQDDIDNSMEQALRSSAILAKMLQMTGHVDEFTMTAVLQCYTMLSNGFLTQDDAIVALDYCLHRGERITFAEALSALNWNATLPMQLQGITSVDISQVKLGIFSGNESEPVSEDEAEARRAFAEGMRRDEPEEEVAAEEEMLTAEEEMPVAEEEMPVAEEETPVAEEETPAAEEEVPVAEEETPAAEEEEEAPIAEEAPSSDLLTTEAEEKEESAAEEAAPAEEAVAAEEEQPQVFKWPEQSGNLGRFEAPSSLPAASEPMADLFEKSGLSKSFSDDELKAKPEAQEEPAVVTTPEKEQPTVVEKPLETAEPATLEKPEKEEPTAEKPAESVPTEKEEADNEEAESAETEEGRKRRPSEAELPSFLLSMLDREEKSAQVAAEVKTKEEERLEREKQEAEARLQERTLLEARLKKEAEDRDRARREAAAREAAAAVAAVVQPEPEPNLTDLRDLFADKDTASGADKNDTASGAAAAASEQKRAPVESVEPVKDLAAAASPTGKNGGAATEEELKSTAADESEEEDSLKKMLQGAAAKGATTESAEAAKPGEEAKPTASAVQALSGAEKGASEKAEPEKTEPTEAKEEEPGLSDLDALFQPYKSKDAEKPKHEALEPKLAEAEKDKPATGTEKVSAGDSATAEKTEDISKLAESKEPEPAEKESIAAEKLDSEKLKEAEKSEVKQAAELPKPADVASVKPAEAAVSKPAEVASSKPASARSLIDELAQSLETQSVQAEKAEAKQDQAPPSEVKSDRSALVEKEKAAALDAVPRDENIFVTGEIPIITDTLTEGDTLVLKDEVVTGQLEAGDKHGDDDDADRWPLRELASTGVPEKKEVSSFWGDALVSKEEPKEPETKVETKEPEVRSETKEPEVRSETKEPQVKEPEVKSETKEPEADAKEVSAPTITPVSAPAEPEAEPVKKVPSIAELAASMASGAPESQMSAAEQLFAAARKEAEELALALGDDDDDEDEDEDEEDEDEDEEVAAAPSVPADKPISVAGSPLASEKPAASLGVFEPLKKDEPAPHAVAASTAPQAPTISPLPAVASAAATAASTTATPTSTSPATPAPSAPAPAAGAIVPPSTAPAATPAAGAVTPTQGGSPTAGTTTGPLTAAVAPGSPVAAAGAASVPSAAVASTTAAAMTPTAPATGTAPVPPTAPATGNAPVPPTSPASHAQSLAAATTPPVPVGPTLSPVSEAAVVPAQALPSTIINQLDPEAKVAEAGKPELKEALGDALVRLAESYYEQRDFVEAQKLYERILTMKQNQVGPKDPALGADLTNLAGVLCVQGKFSEAEPYVKRVVSIIEDTHPLDPIRLADSLNTLAGVLFQQGKYSECEPLLERSLKLKQEKLGMEHQEVADNLRDYAKLLRKLGRSADAELAYAQARAIKAKRPTP